MYFFATDHDERDPIFFIPGINGTSFPELEKFLNTLSQQLKKDQVILCHTDPRIIESRPMEECDLKTMANGIIQDMLQFQPQKTNYDVILYSFSCLLAPYLQKEINALDKNVKFTLIDQPTLASIISLEKSFKIKMIFDIFQKIGASLGLEIKLLSISEKDAFIAAHQNTNIDELTGTIFTIAIPDFEKQISEIAQKLTSTETKEPSEDIKNLHETLFRRSYIPLLVRRSYIPLLVLSNLKEMFRTEIALSETAPLKSALIISTKNTIHYYNSKNEDMGWEKLLSETGNHKIQSLDPDSATHFSIMNPDSQEGKHCIEMISQWHNFRNSMFKAPFQHGIKRTRENSNYFQELENKIEDLFSSLSSSYQAEKKEEIEEIKEIIKKTLEEFVPQKTITPSSRRSSYVLFNKDDNYFPSNNDPVFETSLMCDFQSKFKS